jgi:hypothetical protein
VADVNALPNVLLPSGPALTEQFERFIAMVKAFQVWPRIRTSGAPLTQFLSEARAPDLTEAQIRERLGGHTAWALEDIETLTADYGFGLADLRKTDWLVKLFKAFTILRRLGVRAAQAWSWNTAETTFEQATQIKLAARARTTPGSGSRSPRLFAIRCARSSVTRSWLTSSTIRISQMRTRLTGTADRHADERVHGDDEDPAGDRVRAALRAAHPDESRVRRDRVQSCRRRTVEVAQELSGLGGEPQSLPLARELDLIPICATTSRRSSEIWKRSFSSQISTMRAPSVR